MPAARCRPAFAPSSLAAASIAAGEAAIVFSENFFGSSTRLDLRLVFSTGPLPPLAPAPLCPAPACDAVRGAAAARCGAVVEEAAARRSVGPRHRSRRRASCRSVAYHPMGPTPNRRRLAGVAIVVNGALRTVAEVPQEPRADRRRAASQRRRSVSKVAFETYDCRRSAVMLNHRNVQVVEISQSDRLTARLSQDYGRSLAQRLQSQLVKRQAPFVTGQPETEARHCSGH